MVHELKLYLQSLQVFFQMVGNTALLLEQTDSWIEMCQCEFLCFPEPQGSQPGQISVQHEMPMMSRK